MARYPPVFVQVLICGPAEANLFTRHQELTCLRALRLHVGHDSAILNSLLDQLVHDILGFVREFTHDVVVHLVALLGLFDLRVSSIYRSLRSD